MSLKRIIDLILVIGTMPAWLPLVGCVALLIRINLGRPVLFRQDRPGLKGKLFQLVKFRSMLDAVDGQGHTLGDDQRLTRFGRWLRSTSLDELPELWNVVRGEMSLVGPRPLLPQYLPLYSKEQSRRHEACPGLTGWAQINGRNALSWEEKFALDVWYVDHQSVWIDLKILWRTLVKVIRREGISAAGEATMPMFAGTTTDSHIEGSLGSKNDASMQR